MLNKKQKSKANNKRYDIEVIKQSFIRFRNFYYLVNCMEIFALFTSQAVPKGKRREGLSQSLQLIKYT